MDCQLCRFSHCEYQIPYSITLASKGEPLIKFQLLATIVQVLRRRLNMPTVERLRENIIRTEDSVVTALTLTEQIEKRGEHGWIEPLIKDMGPWMLLQLGDMANLLEVLLKYVSIRTSQIRHGSKYLDELLIHPTVFTNGASHARPHTHSAFL